ncbi:rhomboid family intramembrane serine protease [Dokdonia sp. PRO95]|uniref:rhomboid family intramembrane serine protease n=1 Tax=Dokdonia sp. PRO95 TaxID=1239415 RepID=UPI00054EA8EE|nr:rhomboid family intramembrane serine protease [Dokdonia sp. PRO95]
MNKEADYFKFYNGVVVFPLFFVLLMWGVFWVEIKFGLDFTKWGVRPRTATGIKGVIFSPFIHSGIKHLWHNTVPLLVLSAALFYFYRKISWRVLLLLVILSGTGTWLIGRDSYHIGMSGVIYALVSFLFFKGILAKHFRLIALSLIVVFLYGSLIWGTLPTSETISWEGHLSGFIAGGLIALCFRESVPKPVTYNWEQPDYSSDDDPFMQQFDENGNFFELPPEIDQDEGAETIVISYEYKDPKTPEKGSL